jgi:K+ transporter
MSYLGSMHCMQLDLVSSCGTEREGFVATETRCSRGDACCCCAAWIVIISVIILAGLFLIQQFGTGFVGSLFSPVILVWFAFNVVVNLYNIIVYQPGVLRAFGPNYWFAFFLRNGTQGWQYLGGVVLCITGAGCH